jgi:transposase-like protein
VFCAKISRPKEGQAHERKSDNEIAKDYGVHSVQVSQCKKELIDGAELLFGKRKRKSLDAEVEKAALERKVGQLTIEIDWLKKNLGSSSRRSMGKSRR